VQQKADQTSELKPVGPAGATSLGRLRSIVIIVLLVGAAGAAGALVRAQMDAPIGIHATTPQPVDAAALDAEDAAAALPAATVPDAVAPNAEAGAATPGVSPEELAAEAPQKLTIEVWAEGGKLRLKSDALEQAEIYPIATPKSRQSVVLVPGTATAIDVDPLVARRIAGRSVRLEVTLRGTGPVFTTDPKDLMVFLNGARWPNAKFVSGQPSRIGLRFPAVRPEFGIALTAVKLSPPTAEPTP
jgi:hypothetical protein